MPPSAGSRAIAAKRKRQRVALGILAGIAALLTIQAAMRPGLGRAQGESPPAVDKSHTVSGPVDKEAVDPVGIKLDITWPLVLHRDLFAAPEVSSSSRASRVFDPDIVRQEARSKLTLRAILFGDPPRAIINGRAIAAGESVEGFRVLSVNKRSTIVEKLGVDVELKL